MCGNLDNKTTHKLLDLELDFLRRSRVISKLHQEAPKVWQQEKGRRPEFKKKKGRPRKAWMEDVKEGSWRSAKGRIF